MSKRGKSEVCHYCRRKLQATGGRYGNRYPLSATRDHTVPRVRGGTTTVWACRQCNQLKADRTPQEWAAFMAENPAWWTTEAGAAPRERFHPNWQRPPQPSETNNRIVGKPGSLAALRVMGEAARTARSSVDRVSASEAEGRAFESPRAGQS